jgi:hypothetical protein
MSKLDDTIGKKVFKIEIEDGQDADVQKKGAFENKIQKIDFHFETPVEKRTRLQEVGSLGRKIIENGIKAGVPLMNIDRMREGGENLGEKSKAMVNYLGEIRKNVHVGWWDVVDITRVLAGDETAFVGLLKRHGGEFIEILKFVSQDASEMAPEFLAKVRESFQKAAGDPTVIAFVDAHGDEIAGIVGRQVAKKAVSSGRIQTAVNHPIVKKGMPLIGRLLRKK